DTRRDLHLREVAEKTMQTLRERLKQEVQWVAAEHDDHRPHRHVHVVAVVKDRLHIPDLEALHQRATEAALSQRKERDLAREHPSPPRGSPGTRQHPASPGSSPSIVQKAPVGSWHI